MNSAKYFCQNCKRELKSNQEPCPSCGFKMVFSSDEGQGRESLELRQKQKGFKKFMKEIISGWFPSRNKERFPEGVEKIRVIDKEKDWYREKVKDVKTSEITRNIEQPLRKHNYKYEKIIKRRN